MSRLPALPPQRRAGGMDPNTPQPGYWLIRLVRGGPILPASIERIEHEPGDPSNILDTGPILIANIGNEDADPKAVWVARREAALTKEEHDLAIRQHAWDREYDPLAPQVGASRKPVNLAELPPVRPKEQT